MPKHFEGLGLCTGDFDSKELAGLLEEKLGKWQVESLKKQPNVTENEPNSDSSGRRLYLIDRPGATQVSSFPVSMLWLEELNPEFAQHRIERRLCASGICIGLNV